MKVALKVMFAVIVALVLLQPGSVSAQRSRPPQGGTPVPELAYISAGNNQDVVLVANADGSGVTEVFGRSQLHDWATSWSPDGKYVAVDSVWGLMTGGFITLIDVKQKSACQMPGYVPHEATSEEPEWNPRFANGRYAITFKEGALSSDGRYQIELFLVEVNLPNCTLRREKIRLTDTGDWSERTPTWSPAGDRLAVWLYSPEQVGGIRVYDVIYGYDGAEEVVTGLANPRDISLPPEITRVRELSWSKTQPEVLALAATASVDDGSGTLIWQEEVWIVNIASGSFSRITYSPERELSASWLQDDSRLVLSRETGLATNKFGIYLINPDGTGLQPLVAPGKGAPVLRDATWVSCYRKCPVGQSTCNLCAP